jgi:exosortase
MNQNGDKTLEPLDAKHPAALRRGLLQLAILTIIIGLIYFWILFALGRQWWQDDNYSHGFFVPLFSAFVLWQRRKRLASLPISPSWFGLVVIVGALAVLLAGQIGAELFLSRTSLILLLAGLVIYFFGWQQFRGVLFPWAVLFLMIPIPVIVFNQIAFPLQLLASRLASVLLELVGVPVLREGNIIQLPTIALEVAEACSGIRSLVSLGTLAIIYGYFLEPRISRRVILAVAAIPIAVVANTLRVMGTGLLGYFWDPEKAEGFFHVFQGWALFVLSLLMLFAVHGAMNLFDRWRGRGREA